MNEPNLSSGLPNNQSRTDWEWLATADDDEIDYSDIPPLTETFFQQAKLRLQSGTAILTVNVDDEVLSWFKAQQNDFEKSINAALRSYADAHRS
ncbi:MAG: BrnA antitoxin family protein [Acidobacteria bacterium]|nr:BrnA antitoxin family protein [Acidobacteriota bacterium]